MEATWRKTISEEMEERGDSWDNVDSIAGESNLDKPRYSEDVMGGWQDNCLPFRIWTKDWIYFPYEFDDIQRVMFVPRNPNGETELMRIE